MQGRSARPTCGHSRNSQAVIEHPPMLDSQALAAAMKVYSAALEQHRITIDRLNVYPVPDGDTGTNMAMTLAAVSEELSSAGSGRAEVCRAISHGALMGARGNSGVIVSQLLRGLASTLAPKGDQLEAETPIKAELLVQGLAAASEAADSAVMRPVEGTILSVARASARAAQRTLDLPDANGPGINDAASRLIAVLESAKSAGQEALEATPSQLPVLAEAGVVDAGAAGYLLLLDALLNVVDGRPIPSEVQLPPDVAAVLAGGDPASVTVPPIPASQVPNSPTAPASNPRSAGLHSEDFQRHLASDDHSAHDLSSTRYEVMFLLDASDERIDQFKAAWDVLGDSIVMVGGDGLWNCHIHTDHIGPVIEAGIDVGRPHRIQITDLHEQVAGLNSHGVAEPKNGVGAQPRPDLAEPGTAEPLTAAPSTTKPDTAKQDTPQVGCAVVTVSPAAGLDEMFGAMGAHQIVTGGQTMNPSTAELLAAVNAAPSQQVVVLPNNPNIIAVARQLNVQTTKQVEVVATRSLPAGLTALVGYDPDATASHNAASMTDAVSGVTAGEVTKSVRDVSTSIGHIPAGQWIGLDASGIVATGSTAEAAAISLLAHLLKPEHEIITLIEGAGAQSDQTHDIVSWLTQHRPDVDVELYFGGQDHYPYLFGIE